MSTKPGEGHKFVAVEPSLRKVGGHHMQYSAHVLRAAQELGYHGVIAANRECAKDVVEDIEVLPICTYDYWWRFLPPPAAEDKAQKVPAGVAFTAKWGFTRQALALKAARKEKTRRQILNALAAPGYFCYKLFNNRYARRVARLPAALSRRLNKPEPVPGLAEKTEVAVRQLADDLKAMGETVGLAAGDHVMIASSSCAELLSVLNAIDHSERCRAAHWSVVFRRNLRTTPDEILPEMWPEVPRTREAVNRALGYANVRLYTDTEALTAEHNLLADAKPFRTLPIPHVIEPSGDGPPVPPYVISYLGDARTEKGFHLIPDIVKMSRTALLDTGLARFKLQANYSIPGGEPPIVPARHLLQLYPKEQVELILEAQDEARYWDHLKSSHICLVPYEVAPYSQRSSGIFTESLGLAVPVVVSSGTWMSRLMRDYSYREIARHAGELDPKHLSTWRIATLCASEGDPPETFGNWILKHRSPATLLTVKTPTGASQAVVRLPLRESPYAFVIAEFRDSRQRLLSTEQVVLDTDAPDGNADAFFLLDLPGECALLNLQVYGQSSLAFSGTELQLALLPASGALACPMPGAVYTEWTEIPALLEKMIANYDVTKTNAKRFREEFSKFHRASVLVDMLLEGERG
jgi:hypothetical protein